MLSKAGSQLREFIQYKHHKNGFNSRETLLVMYADNFSAAPTIKVASKCTSLVLYAVAPVRGKAMCLSLIYLKEKENKK